jgi:hypothetical protein
VHTTPTSTEANAGAAPGRKFLPGYLPLLFCLAAALGAGAFYAATYPLNIGLSDCPNYLRMAAAGSSNLINASGHPAFLHWLLSSMNLMPAGDPLTDAAWLQAVQWTHVGIHAFLFVACVGLGTALFGRMAGAILCLLWGFNLLFLGNLNSASPEWLQGDLVLLCLLLCFCARRADRERTKAPLYLAAAVVLAAAYVVKFNSLLLVPALGLIVLCDRGPLWRKTVVLTACGATFASLVFLYASTYHARSTGTRQLTYDHAWVLILALPDDYFQTDPQLLGTASLKWAVLASHVPPEYGRSFAYPDISYGSANFPKYHPIWASVDALSRSELEALVRANPGTPRGPNIDLTAPFCFYYGLELTDALGIRVYREAWLTHHRVFLRRIAATLARIVSGPPSDQVVPSLAKPLGLIWGTVEGEFIGLAPPPDANPYGVGYYNPVQRVRLDGVHFFDRLQPWGSHRGLYLTLACVGFAGLWFGRNRPDWREVTAALLFLLLVVTVSPVLIGLRVKELATITPVYFAVIAIGLGNLHRQFCPAGWLANLWRRTRSRT